MKKTLRRNSDFRCLTCNVGKGQKNGLRKLEIEEGDRVVTVCNKNEIERRIVKHNKEHVSKVKSTDACNDKTYSVINDDETRDNILNGDLRRDKCDDDDVCQFLLLLKRPNGLMPDDEEEM